MDEVYWYIGTKKDGINTYLMTMISRKPRQIVAFEIGVSVNAEALQRMANSTNPFHRYFVDGCRVYQNVDYVGCLSQNFEDKSDTYTIEGTNADLRCYIAALQRKSRCFFRSSETMKAVLWVLINAYNKFGDWKRNYREKHPKCGRKFPNHHINFI